MICEECYIILCNIGWICYTELFCLLSSRSLFLISWWSGWRVSAYNRVVLVVGWPLWHVTGCVGGTVIEHDHLFTIPFHCGTKTWNVRGLFIVLIRHVSSRFKWCLRFRQVTAIQLHLLLLSSTNKEVWMNRFFVLSMGPV